MRTRIAVCIALLASLSPSGVRAQETTAEAPNAAREEARERFERGVGLMLNENWEAAQLEFERSLEAYPTRRALFNLGMCRKALHRYGEALELFRRWQAEYAAEAPEEEVETVVAAVLELQGYLAELVIVVEPVGATVVLDGNEVGTSPLAAPLTVDAGAHVVGARLEGHEPAETQVLVASQEHQEVRLVLAPVPAPPIEPDPPVVPVEPIGSVEPGLPIAGAETSAEHGVNAAGFWTLAAAAVAAGIGGAVTGALLLGKEDEINGALDDCRALDRAACERGPGLIDEYETLQTATNVLLFGGGALAVAATVLAFFTDFGGDDGEEPPVQVTAGSAGGTGASLGLAFTF